LSKSKTSNFLTTCFRRQRFRILLLLLFSISPSSYGQSLDLRFEAKVNYRDSDLVRFPSLFPFPPVTSPDGEPGVFIETVDAGQHGEVSLVSLAGNWRFADNWLLRFKVDAVDLYDRNPTSADNRIDLDAFLLRYGDRSAATSVPTASTAYAQIGKFKKFEQQRERRTESYGVVSTAFNRFEDSGIEAGFDLSSGFYGRFSYTTGNPVFLRDVNALAGDNGTDDFLNISDGILDPPFQSGIVTLYDAEIEDFDLSSDPETGVGLGYRWNSADQNSRFDLLAHYYQRDLAESRELNGTFYGADLDLFDLSEVPAGQGIRLPFEGNDKVEGGLTAWYNNGNFALFAQYVYQEVASLDRDGFEVELSYLFDLPIKLTPVIRYSQLNNDFESPAMFPTPSLSWNWRKIDYGVNIDVNENLRLILEYADNELETARGRVNQNEFLLTIRWQHNFMR